MGNRSPSRTKVRTDERSPEQVMGGWKPKWHVIEDSLGQCWLTLRLCSVNLNHFRLLRVVGKGAFGKVRIVERKDTGLTFALKYIRKDEGVSKTGSCTPTSPTRH